MKAEAETALGAASSKNSVSEDRSQDQSCVENGPANVPDGSLDAFQGLSKAPAHFWPLSEGQGVVQLEANLQEPSNKRLGQGGRYWA